MRLLGVSVSNLLSSDEGQRTRQVTALTLWDSENPFKRATIIAKGLIDLPIARVAAHSFRTAMLDYMLTSLEGPIHERRRPGAYFTGHRRPGSTICMKWCNAKSTLIRLSRRSLLHR